MSRGCFLRIKIEVAFLLSSSYLMEVLEVKQTIKVIKMKTLEAVKVYTDESEYLNSPELTEIFSGYENTEKKYAVNRYTFWKAYVIAADPKHNYGISNRIFKVYFPNGQPFYHFTMKEVTGVGSTLSDSPVQLVELMDTGVILTDTYIAKDRIKEAMKDRDNRFAVLI